MIKYSQTGKKHGPEALGSWGHLTACARLFLTGLFVGWLAATMALPARAEDEIRCLKEEVLELKGHCKWVPAISACERLLFLTSSKIGDSSPDAVEAMQLLAWLVNCTTEHARAENLYRRALELQEAAYGKDSPELAESLRMLSNIKGAIEGDAAGAIQLLERAYRILLAAPESYAFQFGRVQAALGYETYCASGDVNKAQRFMAGAITCFERVRAPAEEDLTKVLSQLGLMLKDSGQLEDAEALLRRVLRWREQKLGPDHADTGDAMKWLADVYFLRHDSARAESLYLASLEIQQRVFDATEQFKMFDALTGLGTFYFQNGEFKKAQGLLERALDDGKGEWMKTLHFRHWGGKSAPARVRARIAQDEFSHDVAARMVVARCQAVFGVSGGISLGRGRH